MKNKFLIGVLTVFAAIITSIIILNITKSSTNKDNYFDRKFSKNEILSFEKEYNKLSKNNTQQSFYSGDSIIELELKDDLTGEYNLTFTDFLFSEKSNVKLIIPNEANLLSIYKNTLFYSLKRRLYKLELDKKKTNEIKTDKLDVSSLIPVQNSQNKNLFFGEVFNNNTYKLGFFILNTVNGEVSISKLLYTNKESFKPEITLKYAGRFQKIANHKYAYTCEDNSKIFFFDENGDFDNEFITKDNTPLPNTIKDSEGNCYFSRDGSKYTNSGVLIDKENIFVFSMATAIKDKIIIDQYSKITQKYIQSFKLNYKNHCSMDIENIHIENNKILLEFESNYASFKFSRYNDEIFY